MTLSSPLPEITERVQQAGAWIPTLREEVGRLLIGQRYLVDRLLVGLLANGHVLLEGVPGLAKTLSIRTLARATDSKFARLQFTPDLLPSDIVGTLIYNPRDGQFTTRHGPIFANLVLADEINRAPAKVQSALLEAMQERQVTLGDKTYPLPEPFLVLATENPIDQEGTYPLPEAQVDRFLLKLKIGYPSREEERQILDTMASTRPPSAVSAVVSTAQILQARAAVDELYLDPKIRDYIVHLVVATRDPAAHGLRELAGYLRYGASPRATIALALASRAWAFIHGRAFVTPQDVKAIAPDVLRHRLLLTYEAEAEDLDADALVTRLLDTIPVP